MRNKSTILFACKTTFAITSILFLSLFAPNMNIWAQDGKSISKISGTVIDDKGEILPGALVKIKSRTTSILTDGRGNFAINASIGDTLNITYIGFQTRTVIVNAENLGKLALKTSGASKLDEVIVVGYGNAVKRRDLTGSVGRADVEAMQKAPVTSYDQALAGRVAGVVVTSGDGQPGSSSQIVIRGSSVSQDPSPLFVIDGFPIENMDINSINPNDIESIEILKDASSIAIYGARGANGVIMIITKRGQSGPTKLTYSLTNGFENVTKKMNMLSPYEFVKLQFEFDSTQSTPSKKVTTYHDIYLDSTHHSLEDYRNEKGTDWQSLLFRQGVYQTHHISLIGGSAITRFSLTGSVTKQDGIIINTGLKKNDAKFVLDHKINDNFRTGLNIAYTNSTAFGTVPTSGASGGVVYNMWAFRPVGLKSTVPIDTLSANPNSSTIPDNFVSPLAQATNEYNKRVTNTTTASTFVEYSFWKDFKFKVLSGLTNTNYRSEAFYNSKTTQGNLALNNSGTPINVNQINSLFSNTITNNYLVDNTLTYKRKLRRKDVIDALVGFNYQYAKSTYTSTKVINIPQQVENLGILSSRSGTANSFGDGATHWQLFSFIGRGNYSLNDKYIFTFTGRYDGSSKFAAGKQWGFFPSGAIAWKFTNERFINKYVGRYLTDGKIRTSYGIVGNNRVGDFSYLSTFGSLQNSAGYPFNNQYTPGITPFFYGNKDLTWEKAKEWDLGTDLSFFNDRLSVSVDYYNKNTTDFLYNVRLPDYAGYGNGSNSQYQNTGSINNKGLEFSLTTTNIKNINFTWTSSFNVTFTKSKILSFHNGLDNIQTGWGLYQSKTAWVAKVGYPLAQFYGFKWGGVYQYSDFNKLPNGTYVLKPGVVKYATANAAQPLQPGDPKYKDLNGDGIIDDNDQTVIGRPAPVHTGGFNNSLTYKGFSLNIFFQWSYGNDNLNANRYVFLSGNYNPNMNQFAEYANRWSPTNPTNDIPHAMYNSKGDPSGNTRPSSRLIEDGSFLRLKTISFGYALSPRIVKKIKLNAVRASVAAQNIFTWTKYKGLDPEVSTHRIANPANQPLGGGAGGNTNSGTGYTFVQPSSGYAILAPGYDFTPYPRAFTLVFGLTVTF